MLDDYLRRAMTLGINEYFQSIPAPNEENTFTVQEPEQISITNGKLNYCNI
ncbi:hypothetical protein I4U23_012170 [Adineta vaga]|nr:hypothetical protein I4U23_012170 [Adineta vaga]